ncbi:hypothetical protein Hanom_Chr05g00433371 [Helianthus anomalus]
MASSSELRHPFSLHSPPPPPPPLSSNSIQSSPTFAAANGALRICLKTTGPLNNLLPDLKTLAPKTLVVLLIPTDGIGTGTVRTLFR